MPQYSECHREIVMVLMNLLTDLLYSVNFVFVFFVQVIFITTLFYLLIYSNQQYLPLHWISDVVRFDSSDKTNNFSRIIRYTYMNDTM